MRFNSKYKKDKTYEKELRGKHIFRYGIDWKDEYVSYGNWIAEPRNPNFFDGEKLLLRQIPGKYSLLVGYTDEFFIVDQSVFIAKKKPSSLLHNKYALAILNSKLIYWFFKNENNEFDELFPKIKSKEFKALPILEIDIDQQQPFIAKADIMLLKNKELNQLSEQFTKLLQAKFSTININNKLQSWHSLTANDFLKELLKQKIKLPLSEQQEWLQYFEQQKAIANNIQQTIQQTDKEIDQMVYALYGLTDEEIKIVESA